MKDYVDSVKIGDKVYPISNYEEITYENLKIKRDGNNLVPGKFYRITNYVTKVNPACDTASSFWWYNGHFKSAEHPFDIIVQAANENTFFEEARCCCHEGDTYFAEAKLEAHRIKYSFDNYCPYLSASFMKNWADEVNGKGVIYYMEDDRNNICDYDFHNLIFKRWKVTGVPTRTKFANIGSTSNIDYDLPVGILDRLIGKYVAFWHAPKNFYPCDLTIDVNDYIYCYTFCYHEEGDYKHLIDASLIGGGYPGVYQTRDNHIRNPKCPSNTIFLSSYHRDGETFARQAHFDRCVANTFSDITFMKASFGYDYNIVFAQRHLEIGNTYRYNIVANDFGDDDDSDKYTYGFNTIGNNVIGNIIGKVKFMSNTIGFGFSYNVINSNFRNNNVSPNVIFNKIDLHGGTMAYNVIDSAFSLNVFDITGNVLYNTFHTVNTCTFTGFKQISQNNFNIFIYSDVTCTTNNVELISSSFNVVGYDNIVFTSTNDIRFNGKCSINNLSGNSKEDKLPVTINMDLLDKTEYGLFNFTKPMDNILLQCTNNQGQVVNKVYNPTTLTFE